MDLNCSTCAGPVFIMGRTAVVIITSNRPRTTYYPAHNHGSGPSPAHKATLADATLKAWAAEMEAKARAEAKRLRKPEKKARCLERAVSYAGLAAEGTASAAWASEEGW